MEINTQKGFTLVELLVVIVILGILAAVAIPQYVSLKSQARISSLTALQGTILSAVNLVKAQYQAQGLSAGPVTLPNASTVAVSAGNDGGIPTAATAGICNAVNLPTGSGFTCSSSGLFEFAPPVTSCNLQYNAAGTVTSVTSGCGA